jgi:hypothetical protein
MAEHDNIINRIRRLFRSWVLSFEFLNFKQLITRHLTFDIPQLCSAYSPPPQAHD